MSPTLCRRLFRPARFVSNRRNTPRRFRRIQLEPLEERCLLSATPTLEPIADVTLLAGAPLHLALDGLDADGDALTYSVSVDGDSQLTASVLQGNQSLRISVQDYGDMIFELFEARAPNVTGRIAELAESGFYDGLTFHRIIENFMIQGGDPLGTGTGGSGSDFDDQFHAELMHTSSGLLSMAKSGDDTNDSQFFITSAATRHLDFNHSVFGILTEGEDLRQLIAAVPTGTGDRPITPVVMNSVDVFTDTENGALMLSAPEGTLAEGNVTVSVSDGNGGTAERTFHVTILPDPDGNNSYSFLEQIDPIEMTVDTPIEFQLPAIDPEGDPIFYGGDDAQNDDLSVTVNEETGLVTIVPQNGLIGVHEMTVYARPVDPPGYFEGRDVWDSQTVALYIAPQSPSGIELLSNNGSGQIDPDGIAQDDTLLSFRISGILQGAEVTLFIDGQEMGKVTAADDSGSVVITTNAGEQFNDGLHLVTAAAALLDQAVNVGNLHDTTDLVSDAAAPLQLIVDTTAPQFVSTPILTANKGEEYFYDAQTDEEPQGGITYDVVTLLPGMSIVHGDGRLTWTPQPSQGPVETISITATDLAGNTSVQTFDVTVTTSGSLDPIGNKQVAEGSNLSFQVTAGELIGPLTFGIEPGAPAGVTIDPNSGEFSWTPSEAQGPGAYEITIYAIDAHDTRGAETILVTVSEVNAPPQLAPISDRIVKEGQLVQLAASATDPDLPADTLTFSLGQGAPQGASINPNTGLFTWQPGEGHGGNNYEVVIRVTDLAGATDEQAFRVIVDEIDQAPQFAAIETQVLTPGEELRLLVHATDPDQPANPITYSLEPGAPEGATIDPNTGLLTWSVPEDSESTIVKLGVKATELLPQGQSGKSSVALVEVIVSDLASLLFDGMLADRVASPLPLATRDFLPDGLFATTTAPETTSSLLFDFQPATEPTLAVGDSGLFGFQIGPSTGIAGNSRQSAEETGPLDDQPEPTKEEKDSLRRKRKSNRSGRSLLSANDEALQEILSQQTG